MIFASAVHDPVGRLVPAIEKLAELLRGTFAGFAFNISDRTVPGVAEVAERLLDARIVEHPANEATIGKARRDAVRLALTGGAVLYSDPDHLLRWIESDPDGLRTALTAQPDADFVVIGRSTRAMADAPARLRETERIVNHVHRMMTGKDWDLLFAVRRMNRRAAELIVESSQIDTLANDVEWPLLARQAGLRLGYTESDALIYRTIEEFGEPTDTGDNSPLQWIRRLEFAGLMADAMRRFLPTSPP
ncbi:MAG TPA: hypothetical protein VIN06_15245 [Devosia sp.]